MSMQLPRACDWWAGSIDALTDDNNQLVITHTSTRYVVTVLKDVEYWMHADSGETTYDGFYDQLKSDISSDAGGLAVTIAAATPAKSTQQEAGGLQISTSSTAFSLDFSDASWTLDPRLLGFPADQSTDVASTSNRIIPPFTRYMTWRSSTILDGIASYKRKFPMVEARVSHDRPTDRFALIGEAQSIRQMEYEYVMAGHVFEEDAADLIDYANAARLAQGDTHNAFETIWARLQKNKSFLLIHDTEHWSIDDVSGAEVVVARDVKRQLSDVARRRSTAGEAYDLDFEIYVLETLA